MKKQTRRQFVKNLTLGSTALGMLPNLCCTNEKSVRPNIILILADDLGYGDLGCYGQTMIKTPNIDRMAEEGMKFTQHYAGSTVCAPSRCSLMTGKHQGHASVRGNENILMNSEETTIADMLKNAGYSTGCIGKWGIGHPPSPDNPHSHGFDYFFGYLSMWHAHNYYPEFLWKNRQKIPLRNVVKRPKEHYQKDQEKLTGLALEKNEYSGDVFTEDALSYIENQSKPFFLFLSFTIPHANNEALWFGEHGMEVPDYGIYKDKDWSAAEKGKAAMISRLDRDVGRILDKLIELGIEKNTLVIFSSDNGPHKEGGIDPDFFNSNGPLRGYKRDLYEGGIRVPTLARWPGKIKAGSESDHISAFWDYPPTFADIAHTQSPANTDGISFLPTLLGKSSAQKQHEYLYWEFHEGSSKQAIRLENWKAVRNSPSEPIEIFDLKSDKAEELNLAEKHPELVAKIQQIFEQVRVNEDRWPLLEKIEQDYVT